MKIVRMPGEEFVQVNNKTARDRRLTFRAAGLLVHLLSLPPWDETNLDDLVVIAVEGRDALRKAMNELETHGYVERIRLRNEAGQWVYEQHVYGMPRTGNPSTGNQSAARAAQTRKRAAQPSDWKPDDGKSVDRREEHVSEANTSVNTSAATASPPAAGQLDLGAATPDEEANAAKRAANERNTRVTNAVYAGRDPKPTAPRVAIVKLLASLLDAGWPEAEVIAAGIAAPAFTRNALEFQLNQVRKPASQRNGKPTLDAKFDEFFGTNFTGAKTSKNRVPTGRATTARPLDTKEITNGRR